MTAVLLRWYPHLLLGSLCAGLAAGNLARPVTVAAIAAALCAAAAAVASGPLVRIGLLAAALAACGWWWAGLRLGALDASDLAADVGTTARATVVVTGPPRHGTYALRMPGQVTRFDGRDLRERILLVLPLGRAPPQGAILELIGTLRPPRAGDSGFDEQRWLRRQGVAVVLRGLVWRQAGRRGGLGGLADRLRSHIERTLTSGTRGEREAVLAGVVLGADEGLTSELQDAFRASGLYHLLAVSGQNIAFIAIGVLGAAWLLGVPRWLGEVAVLASIAGYTLAVGWQPSVVRAGVAGAVASLAWLAARPRDRWYALLLGALVLLAWNPYSLLEPGFQLSFAAVSAIFVLIPRWQRLLEGYPVPGLLGGLVGVAAVCGTVTAPIVWLHFGAVPVYTVPANAMAELSMGPMLGLGLAGAIVHPLLPAAAGALAWLAGWLAAYLAFCARLWAGFPGAQITTTGGLASAALCLTALATIIAAWPRSSSRRT